MTINELAKYHKILIMGYGKEGKATHEFLKKFVPETQILIADKNDGVDYLDAQNSVDLVIKTPGIPKELVRAPYTTATNIFFANFRGKVIGITGTKGKSTTSALIHHVLQKNNMKARLVGNIGNPSLLELLNSNGKSDIVVYELSSYQLDDVRYSPHIAVFLNIFPDHMNYHLSYEKYFAAKSCITRFQRENDYFIYNKHIADIAELAKHTKAQIIPIIDKLPISVENISLRGEHNMENISAAFTVAKLFSISEVEFEQAVRSFTPLAHRLQTVGTYKGIMFINDAAATTPQSTIHALKTYKNTTTLFLGGQDRGYDFTDLVQNIRNSMIENIVLFPDTDKVIKKLLTGGSYHFFETRNMDEAVKWAFQHTRPGTTCLLSSASPSYSLWSNFGEKGSMFMKSVVKYGTT